MDGAFRRPKFYQKLVRTGPTERNSLPNSARKNFATGPVELLRLVEHGADDLPQHILAEFSSAGGTALDLALGLAGLVGGVCSEALP